MHTSPAMAAPQRALFAQAPRSMSSTTSSACPPVAAACSHAMVDKVSNSLLQTLGSALRVWFSLAAC